MTAALQRNKLRLSIGSERAQPGMILSVVDDSRTWALFSVKPGWFICAIFGGDKGWICDTGWHFHSTVTRLLGHPHAA